MAFRSSPKESQNRTFTIVSVAAFVFQKIALLYPVAAAIFATMRRSVEILLKWPSGGSREMALRAGTPAIEKSKVELSSGLKNYG